MILRDYSSADALVCSCSRKNTSTSFLKKGISTITSGVCNSLVAHHTYQENLAVDHSKRDKLYHYKILISNFLNICSETNAHTFWNRLYFSWEQMHLYFISRWFRLPLYLRNKTSVCYLKKNEEVCSSGSEKFQYLFVFAAKSEEKITVSTQDMLANKQR